MNHCLTKQAEASGEEEHTHLGLEVPNKPLVHGSNKERSNIRGHRSKL